MFVISQPYRSSDSSTCFRIKKRHGNLTFFFFFLQYTTLNVYFDGSLVQFLKGKSTNFTHQSLFTGLEKYYCCTTKSQVLCPFAKPGGLIFNVWHGMKNDVSQQHTNSEANAYRHAHTHTHINIMYMK